LSVWEATTTIEPHDQPWIWASYGFPSSLGDQNWIHSRWLLPRSKETYQISLADCPKSGLGDLGALELVILTHFHLWGVTPGTLYTPGFRTELQFCMPQSPFWEHDHSMNHVTAVSKNHIPRHYITTYYHFKRRTYMIGNRDTWGDTQFWFIDRTSRGALKRSSSQFQGTSPERSLQHSHP